MTNIYYYRQESNRPVPARRNTRNVAHVIRIICVVHVQRTLSFAKRFYFKNVLFREIVVDELFLSRAYNSVSLEKYFSFKINYKMFTNKRGGRNLFKILKYLKTY